ncbi:hypothetical protein SRB17_26230 [Streptomyces sp. RB17]|uniref:hypothetical protein n=1 Tax=Streptomyces sp. RB17 TaxID=2585197 RepID=UPI0012980DC8|nr:hypothetical protein [Streptomyces sp. RB17]MQY34653.1 hypothetical protein [Streptomyces sp. RB17]
MSDQVGQHPHVAPLVANACITVSVTAPTQAVFTNRFPNRHYTRHRLGLPHLGRKLSSSVGTVRSSKRVELTSGDHGGSKDRKSKGRWPKHIDPACQAALSGHGRPSGPERLDHWPPPGP